MSHQWFILIVIDLMNSFDVLHCNIQLLLNIVVTNVYPKIKQLFIYCNLELIFTNSYLNVKQLFIYINLDLI